MMKYVKQNPNGMYYPQPLFMDLDSINRSYQSKMYPPMEMQMQRKPLFGHRDQQFEPFSLQPGVVSYPARSAMKSRSATDNRSGHSRDREYSTRRSASTSCLQSFESPSYSRKVFVGGLPTDVPRDYVEQVFSCFGDVMVDWPREASHFKMERKASPSTLNGYVFLVYDREESVHRLVANCYCLDDHFWLNMNSPTLFSKAVRFAQVRPWSLYNINYMPTPKVDIDPRRTVFVGGVPRPATAKELALLLEKAFGPVVYAGVDIDPELRYPKGAARVTFATYDAYIRAIKGRFVKMEKIETNKREVEIKPYVMDDQLCDECNNTNNDEDFAQYFCGHRTCLQYYCKVCWDKIHNCQRSSRNDHRPCVRMGDQTKELSELPHHQRPLRELTNVDFDPDFLMQLMASQTPRMLDVQAPMATYCQ